MDTRDNNLDHETSSFYKRVILINHWSWFAIGRPPIKLKNGNDSSYREIYIQDTVHIGTKLRTRFLKNNIVLPMRKYFVLIDHLLELIISHSKDKHLLTLFNIYYLRKMAR